jgi:NadR type nicotinamide-nucleotide adenylyltransferase
MKMEFIPVNERRDMVPISATDIRKNPLKFWKYIPYIVRPYFVKKVCIFGPESTGKTVLTRKLAKHFKTAYINEYARDYLDHKNNKCVYKDIEYIARGHLAYEEAMSKQANKILFCDTDTIITTLWSNVLFKKCPKWIKDEVGKRSYDLYILLDIDVPWIDDPQRYLPKQRKWFMDLCIDALKKHKRKYVIIGGSWDKRFKDSVKTVEKLLKD